MFRRALDQDRGGDGGFVSLVSQPAACVNDRQASEQKTKPKSHSLVHRVAHQYESDEITSPPATVERARNVGRLTLFLTNWLCPSSISMFTPPG